MRVSNSAGVKQGDVAPIGTIIPYAGETAPDKWLFCDGRAVSRDTYSNLFTLLGTFYGAGDGSTTFNLPDMRGRVPLCLDNLGGTNANVVNLVTARTRNGKAGVQTVTLTQSQMPSHKHIVPKLTGSLGSFSGIATTNSGEASNTLSETELTGTGSSHDNMPPFIALPYIMKVA